MSEEEADMNSSPGERFFQLLGAFNIVDLEQLNSALEQDPSLLTLENSNGLLPIQIAATRGHKGLIRLFSDHGADLEVINKEGKTPVMLACLSGSLYAVHAFYQCGANMNAKDGFGRTLMHYAAIVGAAHTMHYLNVNCHIPYDDRDAEGYTPLHLAVWNNNTQCVLYLLKNKRCIDMGVANKYGSTPLGMAAKNGNEIISRTLILASKTNLLLAKDGNGYSPIDHARHGGTPKHEELAGKMLRWTTESLHTSPSYFPGYETMLWYFVFILPGCSLTFACFLFTIIPYLWISLPVILVLIVVGFFAPLTNHRLPVESSAQNPAAMGAFISGLTITLVCYFAVVWPRLWPGNWFWFFIVAFDYLAIIITFWKLKHTDPGFELVGKIGSDGNPMTIVDVAKQETNSGAAIQYSFCTTCEIVLPEMTKHCKLCGKCCNGFDHHCLWLMLCVGLKNHRLFVIFLFLLSLDNFLFVRGGISALVLLTNSFNPWTLLKFGLMQEKFLLFIMICNFLTGLFGMANLVFQLSMISLRETTYFDSKGTAAFGRRRSRSALPWSSRLRNLKLFFINNRHRIHSKTDILV